MRHTVICGLSRSTIFFHVISKKGTFSETKNVCFDFLYNFYGNTSQFQEELNDIRSQRYNVIHLTYLLFLSDFNETWIFSTDFRKLFKYKISLISVQWQPSRSMRKKGHDKAFRNFTKAPKKKQVQSTCHVAWDAFSMLPLRWQERNSHSQLRREINSRERHRHHRHSSSTNTKLLHFYANHYFRSFHHQTPVSRRANIHLTATVLKPPSLHLFFAQSEEWSLIATQSNCH